LEAYVHGTSTRKVDDLVRALGVDAGISKSEVSRICAELDGEVAAFRSRSLAHTAVPYVFLDATYLKARVDGRVVSRGVVIATGSRPTAAARSSAWMSVTLRMAPSGRRSCAR
jgi:putative transposase